MTIGVNEVIKKPRLISDSEEIVYIKDKRKNVIKSAVIPAKYLDELEEVLKKIEYKIWLERNKKALESSETFNDVVEELGEKL